MADQAVLQGARVTLARQVTIRPDQTCPFCRDHFSAGGRAVQCHGCRTLLHGDCWADAGCTTLGCPGRAPSPAPRATPPSAAPAPRPAVRLVAPAVVWSAPPPPSPIPLRRALATLPGSRLVRTERDREALQALGGLLVLLVVSALLALNAGRTPPRPRRTAAHAPRLVTQEIR